jgi:hypothetical protein
MGAEASVTLIVVLSIRLYHTVETSYDSLIVTSKLPSTKTSLSCICQSSICYFNGLRQGRTIIYRCRPYKKRVCCFQANHLCPIRINFTSTVVLTNYLPIVVVVLYLTYNLRE